jgi:hypothetical protein
MLAISSATVRCLRDTRSISVGLALCQRAPRTHRCAAWSSGALLSLALPCAAAGASAGSSQEKLTATGMHCVRHAQSRLHAACTPAHTACRCGP